MALFGVRCMRKKYLAAVRYVELARIQKKSRIPGLLSIVGARRLSRFKEEYPMAMEHRWGRRIAVDLGVTLHSRSTGRVRGRLRDLSSGGAFVHVPAVLTPNSRAEMVFTVRRDGGTAQIHRFDAVVSRIGAHGVGLMFLQFDPKKLSSLLHRLELTAARRLLTGPLSAPQGDSDERALVTSSSKEAQ